MWNRAKRGLRQIVGRIRSLRRPSRSEAGQSIVIIAVAFVGLLVIVGLAIDLGMMYIERKTHRSSHSYVTSDLAHAFLIKMIRQKNTDWSDPQSVLRLAQRCMGQILVDHARRRKKRADGRPGTVNCENTSDDLAQVMRGTPLEEAETIEQVQQLQYVLDHLSASHEDAVTMFRLSVLEGMSQEAIAEMFGVTRKVVRRKLQFIVAGCRHALSDDQ